MPATACHAMPGLRAQQHGVSPEPKPTPGAAPVGVRDPRGPVAHFKHLRPWRIATAIFLAPAAWTLQVLLCQTLAAHACFPADAPLPAPIWPALHTLLGVIVGVTLLAGLTGLSIAWAGWRAMRRTSPDRSPTPLGVAPSRSHFLALTGLVLSSGFCAALLFTSSAYLVVSPCGRWL